MDTYKIAIDTFLAETSECKASGCAVFTGADIAFQDIQLHTHRNKSELHFMAGHTIHLRREMRRNYERTLIPVIRSVKHISTCGESTELNHGAHF